MLKESFVDESKEIKRKNWSLIYNPEFDQYREKYKNIISVVENVLEGEIVDGVEVEKIKTNFNREYFLLKINDNEFFVKKIPDSNEGGVDEFKAVQEAKLRLNNSDIENVKIVDCIFAFTQGNVKYIVSGFDKGLENVLRLYLNDLYVNKDYKEYGRLDNRVLQVNRLLSDYRDVTAGNMGYNRETDEITLFDLNLKKDSLNDSSDDEL